MLSFPSTIRLLPVLLALIALMACTETPQNRLLTAVTNNDLPTVKTLLSGPTIDVNYQTPRVGDSALATASGLGYVELVRLLLEKKADPNLRDAKGMTPIFLAAAGGHAAIVQMLIDAGAEVNFQELEYGFTPLIDAASRGYAGTVSVLLGAGADDSFRSNAGFTALQIARDRHHDAVVKLLVGIKN